MAILASLYGLGTSAVADVNERSIGASGSRRCLIAALRNNVALVRKVTGTNCCAAPMGEWG
jgi:hypothetical protein